MRAKSRQSRTRAGAVVACAALFVAACATSTSAAGEPAPVKRVLLFHQELGSRPFRARFNATFVDAIRAGSSAPVDIYEEAIEPERFGTGMIEGVVKRFPRIKVVATTLRHVHSTNRHSWSAVASINGRLYVAPTAELDVYDRVGGGDGFASGLFYGLLTGEPPEECVKLGWAHGAMITAFPGDTTMATLEQVRAFAKGGSARIQR